MATRCGDFLQPLLSDRHAYRHSSPPHQLDAVSAISNGVPRRDDVAELARWRPEVNNRLCPMGHPRRRNSSSYSSTARSLCYGILEQRNKRNLLPPREPRLCVADKHMCPRRTTSRSQYSPVQGIFPQSAQQDASQNWSVLRPRQIATCPSSRSDVREQRITELDKFGRHVGVQNSRRKAEQTLKRGELRFHSTWSTLHCVCRMVNVDISIQEKTEWHKNPPDDTKFDEVGPQLANHQSHQDCSLFTCKNSRKPAKHNENAYKQLLLLARPSFWER